ncbi:ATP-grasp domain-containing protein [Alicyclobacillus tolerans]|uniref:ATP-grasp domain-containing protein n=1 Tax=Alicyclobacillus tolerans TaxID=90970 RepID=UPI001F01F505|nr:ATP-grasp domain-containing protein [Alicyclobacillus tolerans]MCF8565167.1 ATP-grasp domain-containing protein [Alicyclobacillus tolerans]
MFSGWLVYNREDALRNANYIKWMQEEAGQLNMGLDLVLREDVSVGVRHGDLAVQFEGYDLATRPDFVIVRTVDPLLNEQFERMGWPTFNNSFVARVCNNKALTHQFLAGQGIPMFDTWFCNTARLSPIPLPYPCVAKTVNGRGGKDVSLLRDFGDLERFAQKHPQTDAVLQRYGPVPGKDVRVFVIGTRIVAAVLRHSETDFRANFSLGGHAASYDLSSEQRALVYKVIEKFNFGLVGIDFLFDEHGNLVLNEIEDVVGSRTLSQVRPEINLVRQYLEFVKTSMT